MSCLDDSNDHLRWVAPTDLNLDFMGITHLDCVTRVICVFIGCRIWFVATP